ncbi:MAG: TIM barrel protein [Firmicutes bacterium]|nr:TIM barrel protein [Bacillota bacterium]
MLYTEFPFEERIVRAAEDGFEAIEFWDWENKNLGMVTERAMAAGVEIACFQGNRVGYLTYPSARERTIADVRKSIAKAKESGVRRLILLTDELGEDRCVRPFGPSRPEDERWESKWESVLEGARILAKIAEDEGVILLLEALNTKVDHKGYFLDHSGPGFQIIKEVGSPNLRLLFDIYHMQVMEGNLISTIRENIELIGHIHVADVPGRHEPGTGEINYKNVFSAIEESGYAGFVGMEFQPASGTHIAITSLKKLL